MKYTDVQKALRKVANKKRKETNEWFFKTGKGEYGYGDKFIGVSMPDARKVILNFLDLPPQEVKKLLSSKIHEHRMAALMILKRQYDGSPKAGRQKIYEFYLKNTKHINNWDLVDVSAHKIIGRHLLDGKKSDRKILYKLVKSKNMWERRIAIITTWEFIHEGELDDTFKLSKLLLNDKEDLLHKAVGWMLREAGKKDMKRLESFIKANYKNIPRTSLRYSIEKFPETKRKAYLKGKF